jgi:hypothetical protein
MAIPDGAKQHGLKVSDAGRVVRFKLSSRIAASTMTNDRPESIVSCDRRSFIGCR